MAEKTRNEVAVGVTVLVVLALTIYIVIALGDWETLFVHQQKITVRQPYSVGVRGLSKGSPVHLGGLRIGQVVSTDIRNSSAVGESEDIYVFFTIKIPRDYQLRDDCKLITQSNLLGGQTVLIVENPGSEGEIIADGQTVDVMLGESVMDTMKREFNPNDPNSLLTRFKAVAVQLEVSIEIITTQILQTLARADTALDTTQLALQDIKDLVGGARIDKILSNVTDTSTNLKLTSREVRRAPWKLLYKPSEKEFKIQALVDSAGSFASGAEQLDMAALRLKSLVASNDKQLSDRDEIEKMISQLEASFQQFQKAEQKFWEELDLQKKIAYPALFANSAIFCLSVRTEISNSYIFFSPGSRCINSFCWRALVWPIGEFVPGSRAHTYSPGPQCCQLVRCGSCCF